MEASANGIKSGVLPIRFWSLRRSELEVAFFVVISSTT